MRICAERSGRSDDPASRLAEHVTFRRASGGTVGGALRRTSLIVSLVLAALLANAAIALATTPAFSQVAGSPFATGGSPWFVAFSPSGGLLATANRAGSVSVFSVASGGALTPVTGSPFSTGSNSYAVAFSPSGGLLAVVNRGSNTVSVFSVASGGTLTPVTGSPFSTGGSPQGVAFSPSGGLLATANQATGNISMFSIGGSGTLTPVTGSPFAAGSWPYSVAFSPSGGLLASANANSSNASVYSVGSDGTLTPVAGSPYATDPNPYQVAFSPTGGLLATANYNNDTSIFSLGAGGALTQVTGSPFQTGTTTRSLAFNSSGGLLATANFLYSQASVFSVGSNGSLTAVAGSPFPTGPYTSSVAFSASGLLATSNYIGGNVTVYVPLAPSSQTPAAISGNTTVAQTLTAAAGTWSDSAASISYQWQLCDSSGASCAPIPGATSSSYVLAPGDAGHTLVVADTATNAGGSNTSVSAASALVQSLPTPPAPTTPTTTTTTPTTTTTTTKTTPTTTPARGSPVNQIAPSIAGTPAIGQVLEASVGGWSGAALTYRYQWLRDGVAIPGATAASYQVNITDSGHQLSVEVIASDGSTSITAASGSIQALSTDARGCSTSSGQLTATAIGRVKLGMKRTPARALVATTQPLNSYTDNLCLAGGYGIRVGYANLTMLGHGKLGRSLRSRIVFATTANPYYSLDGARPGMNVASVAKRLKLARPIVIGPNTWYVISGSRTNHVLKTRGGVIQEVGDLNRALTHTRSQQGGLLRYF